MKSLGNSTHYIQLGKPPKSYFFCGPTTYPPPLSLVVIGTFFSSENSRKRILAKKNFFTIFGLKYMNILKSFFLNGRALTPPPVLVVGPLKKVFFSFFLFFCGFP